MGALYDAPRGEVIIPCDSSVRFSAHGRKLNRHRSWPLSQFEHDARLALPQAAAVGTVDGGYRLFGPFQRIDDRLPGKFEAVVVAFRIGVVFAEVAEVYIRGGFGHGSDKKIRTLGIG